MRNAGRVCSSSWVDAKGEIDGAVEFEGRIEETEIDLR